MNWRVYTIDGRLLTSLMLPLGTNSILRLSRMALVKSKHVIVHMKCEWSGCIELTIDHVNQEGRVNGDECRQCCIYRPIVYH